jgi:hypothetical protein
MKSNSKHEEKNSSKCDKEKPKTRRKEITSETRRSNKHEETK